MPYFMSSFFCLSLFVALYACGKGESSVSSEDSTLKATPTPIPTPVGDAVLKTLEYTWIAHPNLSKIYRYKNEDCVLSEYDTKVTGSIQALSYIPKTGEQSEQIWMSYKTGSEVKIGTYDLLNTFTEKSIFSRHSETMGNPLQFEHVKKYATIYLLSEKMLLGFKDFQPTSSERVLDATTKISCDEDFSDLTFTSMDYGTQGTGLLVIGTKPSQGGSASLLVMSLDTNTSPSCLSSYTISETNAQTIEITSISTLPDGTFAVLVKHLPKDSTLVKAKIYFLTYNTKTKKLEPSSGTKVRKTIDSTAVNENQTHLFAFSNDKIWVSESSLLSQIHVNSGSKVPYGSQIPAVWCKVDKGVSAVFGQFK